MAACRRGVAMRRLSVPLCVLLLMGAFLLWGLVCGASAETYAEAVEGTAGVSHFWPMGESSGSSFADLVGGDDATTSGGVTLGEPGGLVGDSSTSALFNGSSGAAQAPVDLSGTGELTVEFWMKWKEFAADDALALEFTPDFNEHAGGFLVDPNASDGGGTFGVGVGEGASRNNVFFAQPTAEQWHYYVFVIDTEGSGATEITPYVDGHAVSYTKSESHSGGEFADSTLYWMSRDASSLFGAGSMQDLALYETALSAGRIAEHYELGEGGPKASFGSTPVVATAGVPVRLDAAGSSSPGGTITDYAWDFDGSKSYTSDGGGSSAISHTFSSPGTYTVDLRVTDSLGETATISHTITVGAALGQYEQAVEDTTGIWHFWPMGESSGSSFADLVSGADATASGGVTLGEPGGLVGDSSTSALFNGSSGAAQAPVDLSGSGQLTVEFWMKWKEFAADDALALEFTPDFNEHVGGFLVDPNASDGGGTFGVGVGEGASRNNVFFAQPTAEQWHYYAFVIDTEGSGAGEITPYVDGHAVSYTKSESHSGGAFADSTLYWMSRDASSLFGAGSMQDLALYDTALSSSTILEHYERGEDTYELANTTPPNIEGSAQVGQVLTAHAGAWTGSEPISYYYQWQRCNSSGAECNDIAGAESPAYALEHNDVGTTLRAVVTAVNGAGYQEAASEATGVVAGSSEEVSCTDTWVGGSSGKWQTASNWSTDKVPGLSDVACIGSGDAVHINSGSYHVNVVYGGELVLTGGQLEIYNESAGSELEGLYLAHAVLSGSADLTVNRSLKWEEEGVFEGAGATTLAQGATGEIEGYDSCEPLSLSERTFVNEGSLTFTSGTLFMSKDARIENDGAFVDDTETECYEPQIQGSGGGAAPSILNTGTFEKTADTGTSEVGVSFGNMGSVLAKSGTLEFTDGGIPEEVATGSWSKQGEGAIVLSGGTFLIPEYVNRTDVRDEGATVTLIAPPSSTSVPVISGEALSPEPLQASTGAWTGRSPISYAYQWESCDAEGGECAPVENSTTAEYSPSENELGKTVRVTVTATNVAGSTRATSAPSETIVAEPAGELRPPSISGTPDVHQVLYADPGVWEGLDTQIAYQWESCNTSGEECAPVEGETGPEYDLAAGDEGSTLRVRIGLGSTRGSLTDVSPPTPAIGAAGTFANTSAPSVSGTPQSGQVLTASTGEWSDMESVSYSYQWQSCDRYGEHCEDIEGATSATYTTVTANIGDALRVIVTASDGGHSSSQSSSVTQPIAAAAAPVIEQQPQITGTALQGHVLTASTGTWSAEGSIGYGYQWERCNTSGECSAIEGATASAYTLTEADVSSTIRVVVTATHSSTSATAVASTTATIEPETLVKFSTPWISGTVQQGNVLSADTGIWSGTEQLTYAYQWKSCNPSGTECAAIEGATEQTYTIASGDLGSTLRVDVTVTNPLGSTSALSPHTAVVPNGELSVEAAQAVAHETDPAVFEPSSSTTLEEKTITPALHDSGEELVSQSTLTSSSISKETPGELAVNTPSGELSLTPVETLPTATTNPTIVNGAAALFANTWPATDTILRAEPLGAAAILQIRSSEAPHTFSWEARLGPDQQLKQLSDGSVAIVNTPEGAGMPGENEEPSGVPLTEEGEPETKAEEAEREKEETESKEVETKHETEDEVPLESLSAAPTSSLSPAESNPAEPQPQDTKAEYETANSAMTSAETETSGQTLMVIGAPTVTDAAGDSVPAYLRISGDTITMTINPGSETTYPALASLNIAAPTDKVNAERNPVLYGLADENTPTFGDRYGKKTEDGKQVDVFDPNLQNKAAPLHVRTARFVVPYDISPTSHSPRAEELRTWLKEVRADNLQPYITVGPDITCPLPSKSRTKSENNRDRECYIPSLTKYRAGIKDLIHNEPGVKLWGAWNEPDLGAYGLHPYEHRAAEYWQVAQYVANHNNCRDCKIIAGEFALANEYEGHYISEYRNTIVELKKYVPCKFCSHARPSIWGFHDYHDVINVTKAFAEKFTTFTGGRTGKAQMWIGEAGVELQPGVGDKPTPLAEQKSSSTVREERQKQAAEDLETLHKASARIERIYYYGYRAPTEAKQEAGEKDKQLPFDSGLFEAEPEPGKRDPRSKGEARPAYCILAFADNSCKPVVATLGPEYKEVVNAVGAVNPNGLATKVYFEEGYPGEGYSLATASQTVTGLSTTTITAHPTICEGQYRVVATNAAGTAVGATKSFPACG
jgi:hypothetical protein